MTTLGDHLSHQRRRLEALQALLDRERELLGEGAIDGEALVRLAEDKRAVFEQLEAAESERRRLLKRQGYRDDRDGAARAASDAGCAALWEAIGDIAGRVARGNRLNGVLIRMRSEYNRRLLDSLQQPVGGGPLYGPDGQSRVGAGGRLASRA